VLIFNYATRHSRFLRRSFKLIEFLDESARTGMKGATALGE
jgi:hypothetical protein